MTDHAGENTSGEKTSAVKENVKETVAAVDEFQQEHKSVGVMVAVIKKFNEDKSTNLASMIAFWAFFSIFPLLLAFVTLLGFVLPASNRHQVLTKVADMFPMLHASSVGGLSGSWWALIIGLGTAIWSGSAVVRTVQFAFNEVWEVPRKEHPNLIEQVGRSILVLATIGLGLVISTLITGFISGTAHGIQLGWLGHIVGYVIAIALDVGLFLIAFRWLTDRDVSFRDVLPGALLSGVGFWVLQSISSLIISRYLKNAQGTYGSFATVITILWWFYIQSILTMFGAQLNVVLHERLHPRGLVDVPQTEADHRAYDKYAKERTYHDDQEVDSEFRKDS